MTTIQESHGGNCRPGDSMRVVDTTPPLRRRGGIERLRMGHLGKGEHPGDPHDLIGHGGSHAVPKKKNRPDGPGLSHLRGGGRHPGADLVAGPRR